MTLSEFITFCTLKGRVIEHRQLTAPSGHEHEYFRIKIQARGYGATIHYSILNDEISTGRYKLVNYMVPYGVIERATLEQIIKAILPSN